MPDKIEIAAPGAVETRAALLAGRTSALDLARAAIDRIEVLEPLVHAWQAFDPDIVLAQARALDARLAAGAVPGTLAGVPVAVKDIFDTADWPTGYGSPVYRNHRPAEDAHAVSAVRAAAGLVMGKTVTTEFAYFTPGPTVNPWNPAHTPGGSSSGSAAAVACGMVPLAFGSQTAGSLIRPASYCGAFALKPGFGAFSLAGVKPFSPSLDTLGWLARSADDLELMRAALAGVPYAPLVPPTQLKLAATRTHEAASLDAGGLHAWQQGLARLNARGAMRELPEPPEPAGLLEAQKTVMAFEAARSLEPELRAHRDSLSAPILILAQTGADLPEPRYREALAAASEGRRRMAAAMQGLDALVVPAAPGEAPAGLAGTGDPVFARVWTLLGLPCASVPGLLGPNGLPVGLQLVGHPGRERELLATAAAVHAAIAG